MITSSDPDYDSYIDTIVADKVRKLEKFALEPSIDSILYMAERFNVKIEDPEAVLKRVLESFNPSRYLRARNRCEYIEMKAAFEDFCRAKRREADRDASSSARA